MRLAIAVAGAVLAVGPAARADPPAQYSPEQFIRAILSGPRPCPAPKTQSDCEADPQTRRWSLAPESENPGALARRAAPHLRAQKTAEARAEGMLAPELNVSASDVLLTFAVGSDEITAQGKANLTSIAAGLNSDSLSNIRFEIAGYTDVSGRDQDNLSLSTRRAEAVRHCLIGLGIGAQRLTSTGFGSTHLADPTDPTSEANRRVELHRLN
jgi:outer membrane protein OmpA-like peptidoglycan-associated protein